MLNPRNAKIAVKEFLKAIRKEVREVGGDCYFPKKRFVRYFVGRILCNGYWDDDQKRLVVAFGQPQRQWLPLLAHEYAHFMQWKDQCEVWLRYYEDPREYLFEWLEGQNVNMGIIEKDAYLSRELELDCERRTVKIIKKFNLPIDIKKYAQRASAYIYFYHFVLKHRKWYSIGNEPYNNNKICREMPTHLRRSYTKCPKELMKMFEKYCV